MCGADALEKLPPIHPGKDEIDDGKIQLKLRECRDCLLGGFHGRYLASGELKIGSQKIPLVLAVFDDENIDRKLG